MRKIRSAYLADGARCATDRAIEILIASNAFEQVFYALGRLEAAWNPYLVSGALRD